MSIQKRIDERKCEHFGIVTRSDKNKEITYDICTKDFPKEINWKKEDWCISCHLNYEDMQIQEMIHKQIKESEFKISKKCKIPYPHYPIEQRIDELKQLCGCGCK